MSAWPTAPTDAEANAAWEQIMEIARAHCLVTGGAGGAVALATPAAQRGARIRARVLEMHQRMETAEEES